MLALQKPDLSSRTKPIATIRATLTLFTVRVALKLLPFRTVYLLVGRLAQRLQKTAKRNKPPSTESIALSINSAAHSLPIHNSCLPRAFACQMELSRNGYSSDLKIGVVKDSNGSIKAHAWVELDGSIIIGDLPEIESYQVFPTVEITKP